MTLLARCLALVFAGLSVLHIYWAAGGRAGADGAVPTVGDKPLFKPGPIGTLLVALLLAFAATLVLERAAVGPGILPGFVTRWGTWGVAAALTARAVGELNYVGFLKRRRQTRFARMDTRLYSPLALALGLGTAIIAWAGG